MGVLQEHEIMCRNRVLYIGSAVPLETTSGLDAVQQPLKERYPIGNEGNMEGIDTLITVTPQFIQMQYLSDPEQKVIQFPLSSLTLCAAVRCVMSVNGATGEKGVQFVSLNSPLASSPGNVKRPAIFTAITRRTQGRKVLECHNFICGSARDALNLVKMVSMAGKTRGSVSTPRQSQVIRTVSSGPTPAPQLVNTSFTRGQVNRSSATAINGGPVMHLRPAEPVVQNITAGPEFFEPVDTHGYFYSSDKAEVKKFNIEKINQPAEEGPADVTITATETPRDSSVINGAPARQPTVVAVNQPQRQPTLINGGPPQMMMGPRPQPMYVRHPRQPPVVVVRQPPHGPPPPPPPPLVIRPRFFSPPPPRMRPMPMMMPPGPPMGPMGPMRPILAPPIYMRRPPRRHSHSSGSRSGSRSSSAGSRDSRSRSPKNDENTRPKLPNGDANSSSDESFHRPNTPPKDYDRRGKRLSRREEYELRERYRNHPRPAEGPYGPAPNRGMYDYYVYPPPHGGYAPFVMHNPHGRSASLPPYVRYSRSKSPKKGKKGKKSKKNKQYRNKKHRGRGLPRRDDLSTDSYAGYHSEIPTRGRPVNDGYQIYPPRDFRREEHQFINERNFSKSLAESRRSTEPLKTYPTAYDLNDAMTRNAQAILNSKDDAEPDFTMY